MCVALNGHEKKERDLFARKAKRDIKIKRFYSF